MNWGTQTILIFVDVSAERKAFADARMKRLRKMQKLRRF